MAVDETNIAGRWDFTMEEGTTFSKAIDTNIDLTGYTIRMTIKKRPDRAALLYVSTADYITITDAANGIFTIVIPSAVTDALYWEGDAICTVEIESAGGVVDRLLEGKVSFSRRVNGA